MKVIEKAGGLVINHQGNVLLVTQAVTHNVSIPKGGLEPGETHMQAAKREIFEECGIKLVTIVQEIGTIIRPGYTAKKLDIPSVTKRIKVYLCYTEELALNPSDTDILKAEWISPDKVIDLLSWPQEKDFFFEHREILYL